MTTDVEKILLTGVTGFIGFKALTTALQSGHHVRAVVRRERNASDLQAQSSLVKKATEGQHLEWVVIPDFSAEGAIADALIGITVIVHLASPLAVETEDFEGDIIQPAERMLMTVLEAAAGVHTVRRIVITSSCVTLIPFEWNFAPDSERLYNAKDLNSDPSKSYKSSMEAYWASKAYARMATWDFVNNRKPQFDIVNLLPSVVIGPDERLSSTSRANDLVQGARGAVMGPALGSQHVSPFAYVGTPVHVADVARAHIDATDSSVVPGNSEFILSSEAPEGVVWDETVREIARRHFPEEVRSGRLPLQGSLPSIKWRLDTARTQEVFGWEFTSFEETMKELLSQYLQLLPDE